MSELLFRGAAELAGMVRDSEVTARELVEAALERIEELQPSINAFTHVAHEHALETADGIKPGDERPFAGVPIAIKDNVAVEGMPLTIASNLFGDHVAAGDQFLVRRLRDAGFVIVGKTTLPEMGTLPTTESYRFGPTRNPWAPDHTPGGSSGGSAAAVAAGMVPIAHGNDGGGSIRIPAACCGLVGLKPARGRVSMGPVLGDSFLGCDGVLTRTVADTALALDVLGGCEPGDSNWAPPPERPYAELAASDPGRLRIAVTLESGLEDAVLDPINERAVRDAGALLESLGHELEEVSPGWSGEALLPDFMRTFGPMVSMQTMVGGLIARREPTEQDVEPLTWSLWNHAREISSIDFQAAMARLQATARAIVTLLGGFDALLLPTLAQRPVPIGEITGTTSDPSEAFRRSGRFTPYTALFNVTGQPAVSLPLYHGEDGLPVSVQLVGPPAREEVLLRLAAQLEQALPWAARHPELAQA